MQQFLIEASLVCFIGGALGIGLALAIGFAFEASGSQLSFIYSGEAFIAAIACSTLIGLTFGFLPARNAASLDPVAALARDYITRFARARRAGTSGTRRPALARMLAASARGAS